MPSFPILSCLLAWSVLGPPGRVGSGPGATATVEEAGAPPSALAGTAGRGGAKTTADGTVGTATVASGRSAGSREEGRDRGKGGRLLPPPEDTAPSGKDFGPFFVGPPVSETRFAAGPRARDGLAPLLSVRDGVFCFVEDAHCAAALLASADVGIGLAVIGENGPDLPYAQMTFRGGFTLRPMTLRHRRWHPWAMGFAAGYSVGTGGIRLQDEDVTEADRTQAVRIVMVQQLWLAHRPHALHLDGSIGAVRSGVLGPDRRVHDLWGTHVEVAVGFGGWASFVVSGDFLDEDTRVVFGFRTHALAGIPVAAATFLGLWAGGVL